MLMEIRMHIPNNPLTVQGKPASESTNCRDCLGSEVISALCLDSLMLLCSAEHLLDHLDSRRGDFS